MYPAHRGVWKRLYLEILLAAAILWVVWNAFQAWQHPQ
jgi:hypothetical protein